MKTSIATVSISGELPDKLTAISKAGYSGVEIFENDFLAFDGSPADVGRMARDSGLEITLFQPFRDFEGMPHAFRQRTFDRAERKFDIMQELGTDLLLVCSNVSTASLGGIDRAAEDFHELGERAAKRGLRVGYEALAWGRHINDHRDAWEIVRRADHNAIGLVLDSFHTLSRKIDINSIRSIPKEKIFIVQLADAPLIGMDLLYWSRHFRCMPGEGDLPVAAFAKAVSDTGYDGYFSLEIFNDQFRGGSTRAIAADGYRSLIYLADQIGRDKDTGASASAMPARAKVNGVGFVEFTADQDDAADLDGILWTLGFRKTAVHRSKHVSLYRQGDIRLIVNSEDKGFANASFAVHGTSAYAVALKVDDAAAAMRRAVALGAEPFSQAVVAGEVEIPAIRDIGGGVVYLLDDNGKLGHFDEIDFVPVEEDHAAIADVRLVTIDHIAQTVPYEDLLSWLLFYTSIFDTEKTPMVDIIDPGGVVRSQVVANTTGSLRITLNGAENRRTLAGHFMAEKFGSSIQHIAFQTSDIFASASALRQNGFKPLVISPNYYGDVEARFGLEPEFTDRLRAENILYDRDDDGEYFQLYSTTYGEGFFFELVERHAYRGYGAANAPFRIAALRKRLRPEGLPKA